MTDFIGSAADAASARFQGMLTLICEVPGVEFVIGEDPHTSGTLKGDMTLSPPDPQKLQDFINSKIHQLEIGLHGFKVHGQHITISLDPDRSSPPSQLIGTGSFPADHTMSLNMTAEFPQHLPGKKLRSRDPATLSGRMDQFPPKGSVPYALKDSIELEDVDNPGSVLAKIGSLPVRVTHQ